MANILWNSGCVLGLEYIVIGCIRHKPAYLQHSFSHIVTWSFSHCLIWSKNENVISKHKISNYLTNFGKVVYFFQKDTISISCGAFGPQDKMHGVERCRAVIETEIDLFSSFSAISNTAGRMLIGLKLHRESHSLRLELHNSTFLDSC